VLFFEVIVLVAAEGDGFLFAIECTVKDEQISLAAIISLCLFPWFCQSFLKWLASAAATIDNAKSLADILPLRL
jgi:hypothetical protein